MEFPQINLSSDLSSEKINISNFYEVQTKKALDLFFSLGDSLDNNLIFIKSQNPSIDFKDYVTSIKRISSNSLDEFKSNISSIYFFGSIQQSKNEYDLCEIINGIAMGESDIDINIELNSDYFENNKLLLKQLKKEMDIYFSLLFSREYDINFSPTLKNSNQYIFFSKPYQSYAEKIIRYTIETGSKLYERPLVLDKNNLEQSFSIFKGNQNNSVSGDLKQIYELSSLSILSKSRVEKLYKYSASAINYRLNFLFDSKTNFEWILPNDLNEKEMRFEIFLNALRFLIIDNENYLNSFFKFESQTELNMLYENIISGCDKDLSKFIMNIQGKDNSDSNFIDYLDDYINENFDSKKLKEKLMKSPLGRFLSIENYKQGASEFMQHYSDDNFRKMQFNDFYNYQMFIFSNYFKYSKRYFEHKGFEFDLKDYTNFILNSELDFCKQEKTFLWYVSNLSLEMLRADSKHATKFEQIGLDFNVMRSLISKLDS